MFTFSVAVRKLYFSLLLTLLPHLGFWHPIIPEDVQANEWGYNQVNLSLEIVMEKNC